MKSEFIKNFLEGLGDLSTFPGDFINHLPPYKGAGGGKYFHRKSYYGLKKLERRKIIRRVSSERYAFTKKGEKWRKQTLRKYFGLRVDRWDGKWRIVIFDIPQKLHTKRVSFTRKLKQLGFYPIQKSVYVLPYFCEEEVGSFVGALKIAKYVSIIRADSLGSNENEIRKFFFLGKSRGSRSK